LLAFPCGSELARDGCLRVGQGFVDWVHIRCCGNGCWGSALTAGHFWKEPGAGPAKSNQKRSAPPLGTSPGLGVPSLRHCSVGRREGPSLAQRSYPGIHAGMPTAQCLRSASVVNGAPRSTSAARRPDSRPDFGWDRVSPVGASLLAKRPADPTSSSTMTPPSRAGSLPQGFCVAYKSLVERGFQLWERACSRRGQPRRR
jgi:hypothetical protein